MLKVFNDEVERQLDRKVKVVRFDRGGEFYAIFRKGDHEPTLPTQVKNNPMKDW